MAFALADQARAGGYRLTGFDTIGSTNSEALERGRAGDAGRLWLASRHQTAGRGRRGRKWETPAGNLGASLLLVLDRGTGAHAATLGFVAGLALHDALEGLSPDDPVTTGPDHGDIPDSVSTRRFVLKWPNDIMVGGAKLAGIGLESEPLADGRIAVVVGIGVNVAVAPPGMPYPVACLTDIGVQTSAESVFTALTGAWAKYERIWDGGQGMPVIRDLWLERAMGLGGAVVVQYGGRILRGTFETVDETGRLVVSLPDGTREVIAAAEVHFGTVASVGAGT